MSPLFKLGLAILLLSGSSKESGGYIIFGDSLSEGNGIGERIASYLRGKGVPAKNIAKSGRTIKDYQDLESYNLKNKKVIFILGTNDSLKDEKENQKLWDIAIQKLNKIGASFIVVGPPAFSKTAKSFYSEDLMNDEASRWIQYMTSKYPGKLIDIRALSVDLTSSPYRKSDGIHFTNEGTKELSYRLIHRLFESQQ